MSGLLKIETTINGEPQNIWRPKTTYHYIQSTMLEADFVEDVSGFWDQRNEAIWAFKSQFTAPGTKPDGPQTFISNPDFLEMLDARGRVLGHSIGVKYGEGFVSSRPIGVSDMFALI